MFTVRRKRKEWTYGSARVKADAEKRQGTVSDAPHQNQLISFFFAFNRENKNHIKRFFFDFQINSID